MKRRYGLSSYRPQTARLRLRKSMKPVVRLCHWVQDCPVLLVGHSRGGAVITEAGNHPQVTGLVYVASLAQAIGARP